MKTLLITFDLENGTADQYRAAYKLFDDLGFHIVAQNVQLPTTSVMGVWFADVSAEDIRNSIVQTLSSQVPLSAIAVVVCAEAAWWRRAAT